MTDADYHMKQVSQGLIALPAVRSCSRLGLERQRQQLGIVSWFGRMLGLARGSEGFRMSRFWFHLDKNHPTFLEGNGIVEIKGCAMVILTERQVSASDGTLIDAGGDDPDAKLFAEDMSRQLRTRATGVEQYEDLENIYRLFAVLKAVQFRRAEASLALAPLLNYRPQRFSTPDALPALANVEAVVENSGRVRKFYSCLACGGVSVEVSLSGRSFRATAERRLGALKRIILHSRPNVRSLVWTWETPENAC